MNPRQHSILTHLKRILGALLPGGIWHVGQFSAKPCPAGLVADRATNFPAMQNRAYRSGFRKA